jgi:hypothetical protein
VALTLTALRTEIDTDPKALGFAALRTQTNAPEALAARLNEPGASAETLFKSYVLLEDALAEIVLSEFNALTAAQKTALDQFFRGVSLKTGSANMRTTLGALFPAGATRTALIALASRAASRAEALWGEGTSILQRDVASALEL